MHPHRFSAIPQQGKICVRTQGNLDGPIRANRFADSRESHDSRESFQGSRTERLFFANRALGQLKIANRRFEAIRANRSHVMKMVFFARIDSRESPRFALRIAGPSKQGKGDQNWKNDSQNRLLVSHYSAIGDTISCDAPASAVGFRGKSFLRCTPSKACLWTAIGHFYGKKWSVPPTGPKCLLLRFSELLMSLVPLGCERAGPCAGVKIPKIGKEGLGVKKLPFPNAPEKGDLSRKFPIFLVEPCREMGTF